MDSIRCNKAFFILFFFFFNKFYNECLLHVESLFSLYYILCVCVCVSQRLILSLFPSYTDTPSPLSDSKSSHTPSPHTANGVHRQRSSSHCERSKENQHTNRALHDDRDWVTMETGMGVHPPSSHLLLLMKYSCYE